LLAVVVIEERHGVQFVGDQVEEPNADLQRCRLWAAFPQARQVRLQGESVPALADAQLRLPRLDRFTIPRPDIGFSSLV